MLTVKTFTFFPEFFGENSYVVSDETKECVIIDPGCHHQHEREQLKDYIASQGLKVVKILNTHCHIDHVMGNAFVVKTYNASLLAHKDDLYNLVGAEAFARMYSLPFEPSPQPDQLIEEGETIAFGKSVFEVIFTPGHSAGHVSFFHRESKQVFSGDVLFYDSVGRVDLPGGSESVLIKSIVEKLFPLGDDVVVYPGHMQSTTIGREKKYNQLVAQMMRSYKA